MSNIFCHSAWQAPWVGRWSVYSRWFWPSLGRNDTSEVTTLWRFISQFINKYIKDINATVFWLLKIILFLILVILSVILLSLSMWCIHCSVSCDVLIVFQACSVKVYTFGAWYDHILGQGHGEVLVLCFIRFCVFFSSEVVLQAFIVGSFLCVVMQILRCQPRHQNFVIFKKG